jgi:high affinity Mn2+ porin
MRKTIQKSILLLGASAGFILLSSAPTRAQAATPESATPAGIEPDAPIAEAPSPWSFHGQLTYQLQGHGAFTAPYSGPNSFQNRRENRGSFTTTLYVGRRLWGGAELYVNPELIAGAGVSKVLGLAGPPNGETYRVDSSQLKLSLGRLFLRQTFGLGGEEIPVEDEENRIAGRVTSRRIVVTGGKFSGTDVFDANAFAHDPRTQFNNWSLWANATWDYPADTRGYTYGVAIEAYRDAWAARVGSFMEPKQANGILFDHDIRRAHGEVLELEHDHKIHGQSGAVRALAFLNHARMGSYRQAIALNPEDPDVIATRRPGRRKYGFGLNAEQAITPEVGVFLRAGWNDGKTESWAFTEVEQTVTVGVSSSGKRWGRKRDRLGLAFAVNGINRDHRDYLAAGGVGFMLGDGRLHYKAERIVDAYYSIGIGSVGSVSLEAQRFNNPAFNRDRGPVTVYGTRLHLEF